MEKMRIYYWREKKNFGDLLSSYLIDRFCNIQTEWAVPEKAEMVMCGSVLEHLPIGWQGIVAGAGKLHEDSILSLDRARILALRGPLTAKGIKGNFVLADPGLLADELIDIPEKKYELGIVPHWTDNVLEKTPIFQKYAPRIIRVDAHPLQVIREIGECKKIVSSSLHGIILADAFGIPRRIEIPPKALSHPHQEGGLFKWHDYSASLGVELQIGKTQEIDRNKIIDLQHELFDVFREIKTLFS